jgi:hypothetical protein
MLDKNSMKIALELVMQEVWINYVSLPRAPLYTIMLGGSFMCNIVLNFVWCVCAGEEVLQAFWTKLMCWLGFLVYFNIVLCFLFTILWWYQIKYEGVNYLSFWDFALPPLVMLEYILSHYIVSLQWRKLTHYPDLKKTIGSRNL